VWPKYILTLFLGFVCSCASVANHPSQSPELDAFQKGMDSIKAENYSQAVHWLTISAKADNSTAQVFLGSLYISDEFIVQDVAIAIRWWKKAANEGNNLAQYYLGELYHDGELVPKNIKVAIHWLKEAANSDALITSTNAQLMLASIYKNGEGVSQNYSQAAYWYQKAVDFGDAGAQLQLGLLYYAGNGVTQDKGRAAVLLFQSAKQDKPSSIYAQAVIGGMYFDGEWFEQDYKLAAKWLAKPAAQGHFLAQLYLGKMYYTGKGVVQDYKKASYWLSKAAIQGSPAAQFNLGLLYALGRGVIQDNRHAYIWFLLSSANGFGPKAENYRDRFALLHSSKELAEAKKEASRLYKQMDSQEALPTASNR
jgi:TPR repeat protein